jgi:dienelactone hydrolase
MTIQFNHSLDVRMTLSSATLFGNLFVPKNAAGIVLFVHGSGSSRFSTRNRYVAEHLNQSGLATLLFDLLTDEEEKIDDITREFRFDIPMLAQRLIDATNWVLEQPELNSLKIGYFGASTGAAAALIAAAKHIKNIYAVVSRGGRPDLADAALGLVQAPTLLIVGSLDDTVIQLNKAAKNKMIHTPIKKLTIVDGATHLFEEPGKLDEVVILARDWFQQYLQNKEGDDI